MTFDILSIVLYGGFSLILTMGTYVIRSVLIRLDSLEERMRETVSEHQVRQILTDRYDPVLEDIREIKEKVNKLFDLYVDTIQQDANRRNSNPS